MNMNKKLIIYNYTKYVGGQFEKMYWQLQHVCHCPPAAKIKENFG